MQPIDVRFLRVTPIADLLFRKAPTRGYEVSGLLRRRKSKCPLMGWS